MRMLPSQPPLFSRAATESSAGLRVGTDERAIEVEERVGGHRPRRLDHPLLDPGRRGNRRRQGAGGGRRRGSGGYGGDCRAGAGADAGTSTIRYGRAGRQPVPPNS